MKPFHARCLLLLAPRQSLAQAALRIRIPRSAAGVRNLPSANISTPDHEAQSAFGK
jgi:hypothetical protein